MIWDKFLSEADKKIHELSGHGARAGFGKRPAILIIDVNYAFCGDKDEPILESIKTWRNSCGEAAWRALPVLRKLIDAGHEKRIPVIYSTGGTRQDGWDRGGWGWKNSRAKEPVRKAQIDGYEIMPQIAPRPGDIVIKKLKPSAFFGSPLVSYLNQLQVDTLIMAGTTTSGCVRASVIDAFSYNYRIALVEDGCFDRFELSHAANLFDMNAKYGDVVKSSEAIDYLRQLPDNLFDLPPAG